jgi:hypothetical protein
MMRAILFFILLLAAWGNSALAQVLNLPARQPQVYGGQDFAKFSSLLPGPPDPRRENLIYTAVTAGNVPNWMRNLVLITTNAIAHGTRHIITYYVTPDYFCIGSDTDYLLQPMTPALAQQVANLCNCSLPTRKMVDQIWAQAKVRLTPEPIPPSGDMVTVPVYSQYNSSVWAQRQAFLPQYPLGTLVAGDKKDIVISALMLTNFHRSLSPVVIYGWQKTNGVPIQPLYNGHADTWADYSHGVRLVQQAMTVDGKPTTVSAVLTDPALAPLLSDETNFPGNVIPRPYYSTAQRQ